MTTKRSLAYFLCLFLLPTACDAEKSLGDLDGDGDAGGTGGTGGDDVAATSGQPDPDGTGSAGGEGGSPTASTGADGDSGVDCTADAKICPDGSAVGRRGPDCEFAPCPGEDGGDDFGDGDSSGGVVCPAVVFTCADGTQVGPSGPDCSFECPGQCDPSMCEGPAPGAPNLMCDDGSIGGPYCALDDTGACNWAIRDCPDPIACTDDVMICPDGTAVSRTGPNCEFEPCPTGIACEVDGQRYPDGATDVPDPFSCNTCSCDNGQIGGCTEADCPTNGCGAGEEPATACAACGPAGGCTALVTGCLPSCGGPQDCEGSIGSACIDGVCQPLCF